MKRLLCMLLALLCLAGCAAGEDAVPAEGYSLLYKETDITPGSPAAPVLEALGGPLSYTEEPSCAFEGLDRTYGYGSLYITTCEMEGQEVIFRLWLADDGVSTPEGLAIGIPRDQAEPILGSFGWSDKNTCTLTKAGTRLTVLLTDDKIRSIQYEAIFGDDA